MDLTKLNSLDQYTQRPSSTYRVRFQDCDPYLHLNQASYLNYFVNAREDHLRDYYQLDVYRFAKENGMAWVVTKNQLAYLRQVFVNDIINIETHIISFDETTIQVEYIMWDESRDKIKAMLWATYTFINFAEGKRTQHMPEIMDFFGKVMHRDFDLAVGFDERISMLYKMGK